MATLPRTSFDELPFGVGRPGPRFYAALVALGILLTWGIVSYSHQYIEGESVTGLRNLGTGGGATWGLYVTFVVYFVGVAFAGITVAAFIRLFNLTHLKPLARMAEILTIVALVLGALVVLADLGRPDRGIVNLFRYARPESPFFGTFSLVLSGYLFASVVYLFLDGRADAARLAQRSGRLKGFYRLWASGYRDTPAEVDRHGRVTFWLALAIIPVLIAAASTSGFIFGIQSGAAGWYSALQAPSFVLLAAVSGIGHLIAMAAIARYVLKLDVQLPDRTFAWLGNALWILIAAYLYFLIAELLVGIYAPRVQEERVTDALITGPYAWIFWLSVAMLIAPAVMLLTQFLTKSYDIRLIAVAAILVNLAAIGKRYLIVVPSQTHGRLLPYETGSYAPTWVEYGVIVGLLALGAIMILVFFKIFPILPLRNARTRSDREEDRDV